MYLNFVEFFSNYSSIIVFLHVFSATLLIGALVVFPAFIAPMIKHAQDKEQQFYLILKIMKRYFLLVCIVMLILVMASLIMIFGLNFYWIDPRNMILLNIKESLWLIMMLNFIYMYFRYKQAIDAIKDQDWIGVEENIILITKYLGGINLFLAASAVFIGVLLRGF